MKHRARWSLRIFLFTGLLICWAFAHHISENVRRSMRYESMQQIQKGADLKSTARTHAIDVGIMEGMIDITAMAMSIVFWRKTRGKINDDTGLDSTPDQENSTELFRENKEDESRVMDSKVTEPASSSVINTDPNEAHQAPTIEQRLEKETRKCPACAETIRLEALKCRYCQERFEPKEVRALVAERRNIWNQQAVGPITCSVCGQDECYYGMAGKLFCPNCRTTMQ